MSFSSSYPVAFLLFFLYISTVLGLNSDGILLLSFKHSILRDPSLVLENWNYKDESPCGWNGVLCATMAGTNDSRMVSLVLPNSKLLGSIPVDLGYIEHLRHLDLSNNFFNGTIPISLFNSTELQILSLSSNKLSGKLPANIGNMQQLQNLNISDNALTGKIPVSITLAPQLRFISLSSNYFYDEIPDGFGSDSRPLQVLDLSSNLLNGSLPSELGGGIHYINFSYNRLSGEIPLGFATELLANATIDLSYNNITGALPEIKVFANQKPEFFAGNPNLCGGVLKNPCLVPSTLSSPPNVTSTSPAIAAIPLFNSNPKIQSNGTQQHRQGELKPGKIAAIVVAGFAALSLLCMVFVYKYQARKRKKGSVENQKPGDQSMANSAEELPSSSPAGINCFCLKKREEDERSETSTGSEIEEDNQEQQQQGQSQQQVSLITLDGETELELEKLLKASAYILGATGSSIVYKTVLEDGTTFAVRRIGEIGVERLKDFENQARLIAKLRHPNLVRLCGLYWGAEEKLLIYDYAPNGNLASACYRKLGSSPFHLSWEARLRIAKGVARGLVFLHEKKQVHGNLKPSNILLGPDMEPRIGDFRLQKLIFGDNSNKSSGSAHHSGSKRSTMSRGSVQELPIGINPSGSANYVSPYQAPEALKNLKPNRKWDAYSFGIVLLEMMAGKIPSDKEITHWNTELVLEEKNKVLRMVDAALREEIEDKVDSLVLCFELGFSCASLVPQKRPSMKEAMHILDKIPSS